MMTLVLPMLMALAAADTPFFEAETIFPPGPGHNHGSTIVQLPDGDLLTAWFSGKGEKGDDTLVIKGARKPKGAAAWTEPFLMADSHEFPDQNPVLFVDPQNTLWLFWITPLDNTYNTYIVLYKTSTHTSGKGAPEWDSQNIVSVRPQNLERLFIEDVWNNAKAYQDHVVSNSKKYPMWLEDAKRAAAQKLTQRVGWMTRIAPIMVSDKRMMLPLYADKFGCSLAAFTEDGGKTWTSSEPILSFNVQASFVKKKNGDIAAFMRDCGDRGRMPMSVSKDGGMTWSHAALTDIPNPDSSVDCIALASGNWVLVCNDTDGGPRGGRSQLTALLSDDEGATWKWKRSIEKHGEECAASYPGVTQAKDGVIHSCYTYSPTGGESIKHAAFNEAWIRAGDAK